MLTNSLPLIDDYLPLIFNNIAHDSPLSDEIRNLEVKLKRLSLEKYRRIMREIYLLISFLNEHQLVEALEISEAINQFELNCRNHSQGSNIINTVALVAATFAITIMVAIVGFGIGFSLSLWSGPGAFINGILLGEKAAEIVLATSVTLGIVSGGLGHYTFFDTSSTTRATDEFANHVTKYFL